MVCAQNIDSKHGASDLWVGGLIGLYSAGIFFQPPYAAAAIIGIILLGVCQLPRLITSDLAFRWQCLWLMGVFLLPAFVSFLSWLARGLETRSTTTNYLEWLAVAPLLAFAYRWLTLRAWQAALLGISTYFCMMFVCEELGLVALHFDVIGRFANLHQTIAGPMMFLLSFCLVLSSDQLSDRVGKLVLWSGAAVLSYCALMTGSRAGYLVGVSLLLLLLFQWSRSLRWRAMLSLCIGAWLVVGFSYKTIEGRLGYAVSDLTNYTEGHYAAATSVGYRLAAWKVAIELIKEQPWVGFGKKSFTDKMNEVVRTGKIAGNYTGLPHAHNQFFDAAVSDGLPSAIAVTLLFLLPGIGFFWAYWNRASVMALYGIAIIMTYSIIGLTEVTFHFSSTRASFALFVVCALVLTVREMAQHSAKPVTSQ